MNFQFHKCIFCAIHTLHNIKPKRADDQFSAIITSLIQLPHHVYENPQSITK
jgi:hypothetical protein